MQPSDPPLRKVFLYGHLSLGIGKCLELAFHTPAEAVRLIELNFPGFAKRFKRGLFHLSFRTEGVERDVAEEYLTLGFTGEELHIMPRAIGRGKGKSILTALVGGLVIGAAFFFSGGTMATALPGLFGATGATYGTLATFGVGLVMNGIGTLLSPTPKTNYEEEGAKSFIFNGPVNVADQGGPVPLVFGKMLVGTVVISAALDVDSGSVGSDQRIKEPALHITRPLLYQYLRLSDLVEITEGAQLTRLAGAPVPNLPEWISAHEEIAMVYYRDGTTVNDGTVRALDSRYPQNLYHLAFRWRTDVGPIRDKQFRIPFEVTTGGVAVAGTISVTTRQFVEPNGGNR